MNIRRFRNLNSNTTQFWFCFGTDCVVNSTYLSSGFYSKQNKSVQWAEFIVFLHLLVWHSFRLICFVLKDVCHESLMYSFIWTNYSISKDALYYGSSTIQIMCSIILSILCTLYGEDLLSSFPLLLSADVIGHNRMNKPIGQPMIFDYTTTSVHIQIFHTVFIAASMFSCVFVPPIFLLIFLPSCFNGNWNKKSSETKNNNICIEMRKTTTEKKKEEAKDRMVFVVGKTSMFFYFHLQSQYMTSNKSFFMDSTH